MDVRPQSRHLTALSLRLPARFEPPQLYDIPAESEEIGAFLVGIWRDATGGERRDADERSVLAMWVGPQNGYPTIAADTASRQLHVKECVSPVPAPGTRVIEFGLATPQGRQDHLGAVWQLAPGRYLRLLAVAADSTDLPMFRRALRTIRWERR